MDFVAALEQQIHRTGGGGGGGGVGGGISGGGGNGNIGGNNTGDSNETIIQNSDNNNLTNDANFSPKEMRKFDSKKRWKNWGWKYSPGKTSSIEEEPIELQSAKTSRHSSPNSSPKHKKSNDSTTTAATVVSNLLNQSPLRRRPQSGQSRNGKMIQNSTTNQNTNNNNMAIRNADIRSSAGARLCQTLDSLEDDGNDEFQALIINGRPASVHIVPMSSTQLQ